MARAGLLRDEVGLLVTRQEVRLARFVFAVWVAGLAAVAAAAAAAVCYLLPGLPAWIPWCCAGGLAAVTAGGWRDFLRLAWYGPRRAMQGAKK